jgi:hypothetical protein
MYIVADGEDLHYDLAKLGVTEALAVVTYTGLSVPEWRDRLDDIRGVFADRTPPGIKCLQAFVWCGRRRNGHPVTDDIAQTEFDLATLDYRFTPEEIEAGKAAKAAVGKPRGSRRNPPPAAQQQS